jgi:hypothetical protein
MILPGGGVVANQKLSNPPPLMEKLSFQRRRSELAMQPELPLAKSGKHLYVMQGILNLPGNSWIPKARAERGYDSGLVHHTADSCNVT